MTVKDRETGPALDRRGFLKRLGGASTMAVAASGAALAAGPAAAYEPGEDETRARYQESAHVQAYYRTNRY